MRIIYDLIHKFSENQDVLKPFYHYVAGMHAEDLNRIALAIKGKEITDSEQHIPVSLFGF